MDAFRRPTLLLALAVAPIAGACRDLRVTNPNAPDATRAIASPEDAVALVGGSFRLWFHAGYDYHGPAQALSNAAFQHTSPWACCGMEEFSRIPRVAFENDDTDPTLTWAWDQSYRALRAVADGLASLQAPGGSTGLADKELQRAWAFGRFVQGLAHATVAVVYAEGFVVDEDTDPRARPDPLPYADLMEQAMAYFDASLALAENATWTLPQEWMQAPINARELARATHALEARYQAAGARTPAERAALDWDAILADVDAGIAADLVLYMDDDHGWSNDALGYGTYPTWSQLGFFVYGMADQSGSYQLWNARPLPEKNPVLDGRPMLIVTPDLRFPQGSTVEEQSAAPGRYFRIRNESAAEAYTWSAPHRGTWRWSWYKHARGGSYWDDHAYLQPEIRMEEMRLLRAEGLYRRGDLAGAAALVNETRVAAGLSPTDASGANASCVPRLPDGRCGDLWEMLKWEKRMETAFQGPVASLWYFDGRGWGDLWQDTFLHLPIPCGEATLLYLECETAGGPGGEDGAPRSTYAWNGEGGL